MTGVGLASGPAALVDRLCRATNAHDLDGVVACFAEEYRNDTPAHPERGFVGREQVRRNWEEIFAAVPDVVAELLRCAADGDVVWSEWEHRGHRLDGTEHIMRGVIIFGVSGDLIRWARFYLEPVQAAAGNADAFRDQQLHR
ncbi:MAG: hypothetical protein JWM12_2958 [Ilumatobacteraceae bacterium]|nr:hypothetical protein [Ilumatobacteraceae bacterium]